VDLRELASIAVAMLIVLLVLVVIFGR